MSGLNVAERETPLRRFMPYPAYKNSGVEWLEQIPEHWNVKRLKLIAPAQTTRLDVKPDDKAYIGLEHIESWTGRLLLDSQPESVDSLVGVFEAGDVLFGKLRPYLAKAARPQFDGVCTSEIVVLRPGNAVLQSYVMYCLLSAEYILWLDSLTFGTKMPRASPEQIGGSVVPLPSLDEQRAIAAFLDRETARIDVLVAKYERLIELLQERRTALITRAVTKGLDSSAPMKDSGVEWLGEIPASWEVVRSKRLFKLRNVKALPDDTQLTASQQYGVIPQADFMTREGRRVVQVVTGADILKHVEAKDFVISMRSFQGGIEWSSYSGAISSAYVVLSPSRDVWHPYYVHLLKSRNYIQALQSTSDLVRDGQALRFENFAQVALPSVPLMEQRAIAAFLDRETARIDALIAKVREAIDRIKELRMALISAAVTGKIDVRGEV